jgi:hypothetical protein
MSNESTVEFDFGLVVKVHIDTQILIWAINYQKTILGVPYHKLSKTRLMKFLKDQIGMFGTNGDSLFGSSYNPDEISAEDFAKIEKAMTRIFDRSNHKGLI